MILLVVAVAVAMALAWRIFPPGGSGDGSPLAEVTVPDLTGEAREGEALFNAKCASCHGANAAGRDGEAPPLVHVIYEPGHHGDGAFVSAVRDGVRQHHWPFGDMAPVEGVGDDDLGKIVAYVRALQRANGID